CVKDSSEANTVALGGKIKQPSAPKPSQTSIVVLNGNGVAGAAADANYRLVQRGYNMQQPPGGRAPKAPSKVFHTRGYYHSGSKRGTAAAASAGKLVAPAEPAPLAAPLRPFCGGGTMVCIVVGVTYHNSLTPLPQTPVIKHQPPSIYYARSSSEPLAQQAQRS